MLALQKTLDSSWEIARVSLRQDLDTIQTVLNRRWGQTFGASNTLSPASGGSGAGALTKGSVVFVGTAGVYTQNNGKFFWDNTNFRLGLGTATPTYALDIQAAVDGTHRARVQNSSTGTGAFADIVLSCGTINAYVGASGQNYTGSVGGAADAKRSWLDTATTAGSGWDYSAPAVGGSHRFFTEGYVATNERLRIDTNVTLYNSAKLTQGGTGLALGTTSTDGIIAQNITAATGGVAVQISPRMRLSGTAWDTDDSVSRTVSFFTEVLGVSAATVTGSFKLGYLDPVTSAITYPLIISSLGGLTVLANFNGQDFISSGANGFQAANGAFFFWATRAAFSSPADGKIKASNNAVSAGVLLDVSTDAILKVRTRADAANAAIVVSTLTSSSLTSGKIPIASVGGLLIDGQTPLAGTKVYYVSDTSGGAVTRKLTFTDGILTSET